ncbi:MAG: hypothetical protein PHY54_17885 [Methylococcales bacterium]|nr:hypothetical protein [Methylococcales bacterium]
MSTHTLQKLTEFNDGIVTGPMSPMLFAQEIAKHFELGLLAVYRVNFDDRELYQEPDEPGFLTGYDTLLVVMTQMVVFGIDRGVGADLVAMALKDGDIHINPLENSAYVKELEVQQIEALMFEAHGIYKAEVEHLAAWRVEQ